MRRLISFSLVAVFIMWILPLGVFIAPSQEKQFCGGQRAICLCSHMKAKNKQVEPLKIVKSNAGAQKETSGFFSSAYEAESRVSSLLHSNAFLYASRQQGLYKLTVLRPVEHVPKA